MLASAPAPSVGETEILAPNSSALAEGIVPTLDLRSTQPPPPDIPVSGIGGGIGVGGGGKGRGFLDDAFKEPEKPTERIIATRPAPAYATTVTPSLLLIDGLGGHNEQEDEELILLALHRFGWIVGDLDLQVA